MGLIGSALAAVLGKCLGWLSSSGAVAVVPLGTFLFGLGGLPVAVPVLLFFLSGSLISGLTNEGKAAAGQFSAKGRSRDWGQVAANGRVPALLTLVHLFVPGNWYLPAVAGGLAAVTADTWATELGTLGKGPVVDCLSFRPVPTGTSGGISLGGSLWAAAGAIALALAAAMAAPADSAAPRIALGAAGAVGGFLGAAVDSILGAGLQARFRCPVCGRTTEKPVHCDRPGVRTKGLRRLNNDGVNFAAAASGALCAWGLFGILSPA